jgi:hypothetical protein
MQCKTKELNVFNQKNVKNFCQDPINMVRMVQLTQGVCMEVKSIFMNLIMRTYEKQNVGITAKNDAERPGKDTVTISKRAGSRLFRDIMENSLQKGLNEVITDEN